MYLTCYFLGRAEMVLKLLKCFDQMLIKLEIVRINKFFFALGFFHIVKLLIPNFANISSVNTFGRACLHEAAVAEPASHGDTNCDLAHI